MEKQETARKQGNVMKIVKKKWGVGEEMRKEAAHGVTDEVMIGRKREERERGRR